MRVDRARSLRGTMVVAVVAVLAMAMAACTPKPASLTGTVTLQGGGPATGLPVSAHLEVGGAAVATTHVGPDGTFRFAQEALAEGEYFVRLGNDQHGEFWGDGDGPTAVVASNGAPPTITAEVVPTTVTATVSAADGVTPLVGATVDVLVSGTGLIAASTTTAADGSFTMDVAPTVAVFRASMPGKTTIHFGGFDATSALVAPLAPGETVYPYFSLHDEAPLSGRLLDGSPVSDAHVLVYRADTNALVGGAATDATGSFAVRGLWPMTEYRIVVLRGGRTFELPHRYPADLGALHMPELGCTHPDAEPGADFSGADLAGAALRGCDLTGADLSSADLTGADLSGADLTYADLTAADLSGADLAGAVLRNADLTAALLGAADLSRADLAGAGLDATDLSAAVLTGVSSGGIGGAPAALPSPWLLVNGHLLGPGASLRAANLSELDLGAVDLSGADLTQAEFYRSSLDGADLSAANLEEAYLRSASLVGADLSGVNAHGAVLHETDLSDARVDGAILLDAYLMSAVLDGATLAGAWLVGADLTAASLHGTNLTGSWFGDAELADVESSGIVGVPASLPVGWVLVAGQLAMAPA